jgi:16S rRNA (uracil1498-N3)-methyltransferase
MKAARGRVPRFHVAEGLHAGARLDLSTSAAHHATRVLRLETGDAIRLFDGTGGEYEASIFAATRGAVTVDVGAHHAVERESPLRVTLVQGVTTTDRMDFIIQKSVELGVAAVQPVLCGKSVVRLSAERAAARLEHWRRVAIAACEQCGRNRIPDVRDPLPASRYAPSEESAKALLAPRAEQRLRDYLRDPLTIAVGPEAGFDADEEQALEAAGFVPVHLGPRVLRAETAALAALAALNALQGDF